MNKNTLFVSIIFLFLLSVTGNAQFVSIINKKFVVNGNASCPIYFNGCNNPWEAWNDFGGSYNVATWATDMANLKAKGVNTARIWFSCNGSGQPSVVSDGTASAPTAAFWKNCDSLFAAAQRNGVYIMATMMSFDHTKSANAYSSNWQQMINTQAKTQTYIDNYLVPFVNRYKTNPYLWSIDLCNEIEWIKENTDNWSSGTSYAVLQRFIGQCAAALHGSSVARADGTTVLVTLGSAATKWNGTKMRNGSYGTGWQNNPDGNKWSDAAIQAQFSNTSAYLDFYSPHFYGWINEYYSNMFEKSPTDFGIDEKACIVGEMPARDPFPIPSSSSANKSWTMTNAMNALKTLGWQGHQPWTANINANLTSEVGTLADFGAAALAFKNANASLVVPTCATVCTTTAPTVNATINVCQGSKATALTATGTSLLWYTTATGGTGSSTTITPSTTTVGTTNYYVSQTLNGCEGPRATISVIINTLPALPTVTTPITYTQYATAIALSATGTALKWYTTYSGGTALSSTPTPSTAATGSTNYYVSQTIGNCESQRATIVVTVNPLTQTIALKNGWNLISLNVSPNVKTIESIFAAILSKTVEIKNAEGFWRNGQSAILNKLDSIGDGEAYFVKVSADCSLQISGVKTLLPLNKLLKTGWNLIGVPTQASVSISTLVGTKPISFIKNFDGFWQASGTSSITTLDPGKGYFINATAATTVSY